MDAKQTFFKVATFSLSLAVLFVFFFSNYAISAQPGLDLFYNGSGVNTWTTNADDPFTALDHWVKVIDHDGIADDGSSHTVEVTYPNGGPIKTLGFSYKKNDTSAYYGHYDNTISQPINAGTYSGAYVYRVEDSNGDWSEVTDELVVNAVTPSDESTFAPKFTTPHSITAFFDNVFINGSLYDDFESGFDDTKWNSPPSFVSYEAGAVRFDVDFNPGRGSYWLDLKDPSSVNEFKATVRIADTSGSDGDVPRARLTGTLCNDSWGEVYGGIHIRGNEALYALESDRMEGNHSIWKYYVPLTSLGPVTQGNNYELTYSFDEPTATFTFKVKGLDDSVDYSATYTIASPVRAADYPFVGLSVASWIELDNTTTTFNWDTVPEATYYRVRIYTPNNETIWRSYNKLPPYTLPPGILKPNSYYKYRIDALHDHQWFEWDNAAASDREKTRFLTGRAEAQDPHVDVWSTGVQTWNNAAPVGVHTSFDIRVYDAQGVPENIESVKAILPPPLSTEVNLYLDGNESPTRGVYRGVYFGPVQDGEYTFSVVDKDGNSHSTSEVLTPDPIDRPSETTLQPADNAVVGGTEVSFDWEDVSDPDAMFYDLALYDKDYNYLFGVKTTDSEYTLTAGILKENSFYRYRIYSRTNFFEDNVDNGSTSPPFGVWNANTFFTTETVGSAIPQLSLGNFGVAVWHGPHPETGASSYALEFFPHVADGDGVPENIKKVEVTYPDGITKRLLHYDNSPDWGSTYLADQTYTNPSLIQHAGNSTGIYTFTVEDFEGHVVTLIDTLPGVTANILPWPTGATPIDGTIVNTTTPTITWNAVSGAQYYKVRIMSAYTYPTVHWSGELTGTSYTLPADILEPNQTYGYRVYAYREPSGNEVDFFSSNRSWHSTNNHLTVPDTPEGSDIEVHPIDHTTGDQPATLTFDNVTGYGTTSLTTSDDGNPPPSGFKLGHPPTYYDLSTTASYSGALEVCLDYSDTFYYNEPDLNLVHYEGGQWTDVTTSIDTLNNIICGSVTSLSPFVIVEPEFCQGDFEIDGDVDGSDLAVFAADFGRTNCDQGETCEGDFDHDNDVDGSDLAKFAANFGRTNCASGVKLVVEDSWDNPGTSDLHGLAFDGSNLWVVGRGEDQIHKLDAFGNIVASIDSPGPSPTGLTFDGANLWNADDNTLLIYQLDTDGNVLSSFSAPGGDATGLTFDGTDLWNADFSEGGRLHHLDTVGNLIQSYPSPDNGPEGLAFDGEYLWHVDYHQNKVYKMTLSGLVIQTIDGPGSNPIGLTYDGMYLWLADQSENKIYKMEIQE